MFATITSKGQITIPIRIREKLNLKVGDRIEFDENAPLLTARRVIDRKAFKSTLDNMRRVARNSLADHPWGTMASSDIIDELRGGPADTTRPES